MIPLAKWLADRTRPLPSTSLSSEPGMHYLPEIDSDDEVRLISEPASPSREEELLVALKHAEERIEETIRANAESESRLCQQLGCELASRLVAEINRALEDMLGLIEDSLFQVLVPFLSDEARTRSVSDLLDLIRQELRSAEVQALEIRAPAHLHKELAMLQEQSNVAVTVIDSETIEIVLTTQHLRFEELSSRWHASLEGIRT
jgi:hypothetical protein